MLSREWAHDGCCEQDQELGVALLQKHMKLQSTNSSISDGRLESSFQPLLAQRDSEKAPAGKLLIMILSCHKHAGKRDSLLEWAHQVHPGGEVLIVMGRPKNRTMITPYELSMSQRTLLVNVSDTYDALAVKVIEAYRSIFEAPELANVTYVYKIDDTSVGQDLADYNMSGFNATSVQKSLESEPGDYLTSEWGYSATNCATWPKEALQWHFGRVPETSYWHNREQPCHGVFTYANGAFGYLVSRRAIGLICKHWPPESMGEFYRQFIYEDMAVGITLRAEGITPSPVRLAGHVPWNSRNCPCPPGDPSEACNSWCEAHQPTHNCCFETCRQFPGLCATYVF